jgi:hypothetical protein
MSTKFDRLKEHVASQYEARGLGRDRAEHIGAAVAGKVAREQEGGEEAPAPAAEEPADG